MFHEPTDDMACPECESTPDLWKAMPHEDMADFVEYQGSIVVPYYCDECNTSFEITYVADQLGY